MALHLQLTAFSRAGARRIGGFDACYICLAVSPNAGTITPFDSNYVLISGNLCRVFEIARAAGAVRH